MDVVSRCGYLLLNVGLKADGTIPREQRECLEGLGAWNDLYGPELVGVRAVSAESARAVRAGSASDADEAWVRLQGHGDHVVVVADASASQLSGLPLGFDYSRAAVCVTGALCAWDGQCLHVQAGENLPRDARGNVLPIVITAPSA